MSHIFRHIDSGKLYTIEHVVLDIRYLNSNGFAGIYAAPYKATGDLITHIKRDCELTGKPFNPEQFVKDNFEIYSELW